MTNFEPLKMAAIAPGLVLRTGEEPSRYFRLTHIFADCVYGLWVGSPENARYARRPLRMRKNDLERLASAQDAAWGRLPLPTEMSAVPPAGSELDEILQASWALIQPLITAFEAEANLSRGRFSSLIARHATTSGANQTTLQRLIKRYYYFGSTRLGLLPLTSGAKPEQGKYSWGESPPRRRGRQTILAKKLGYNDFIVGEEDIADMVACFETCLRAGPTFVSTAHEEYLAGPFRRRHPEVHAQYITNRRVEPVTVRQFRYYIDNYGKFSDDLARNRRTRERKPGFLGSLQAAGPGELYEIDATGGRIVLVSTDDPPIVLGTPVIYLIIDRWSRFVVSAYISLRAASYEEVRHALLIAFTSRERRFRRLGIDVNDKRWPVGRMPAVLCPDRGSDFMSESMEQAVVQDLRIELTPLPPYCPDGKAIVERLIRELKRRMASSRMKGVYADRPLDPHSKRAARTAKAAAVHSLAEAYRLLVEFVVDHNNRPHSTLRKHRILSKAGVQPTPKDAYLWGLKHITGLRMPPFSNADYGRLLLGVDRASIGKGTLRYKTRPYLPANEAAIDLAARSTLRATQIDVRLDRTDPAEIYVPTPHGDWARFQITPGAAAELSTCSLDEEEALSFQTAALWANAEHEAKIKRVAAKSTKTRPAGQSKAVPGNRRQTIDARARETADLKRKLTGKATPPRPETTARQSEAIWARLEEDERLRNLELIRRHRSKR